MPISMVPMEHLTLFAFDSGKELPMDMEFPHETKVNLQVGRAPIQSKEVPRSADDHTHVPGIHRHFRNLYQRQNIIFIPQAATRFVQVRRPTCAARLMLNPSSSAPALSKVGRVMRRKSQSSSSSSKHSDLTEENVEAHNRRTRNYQYSNHTGLSPERRSHASSSATSSTSFSTFIAKMRGELGSWFSKRDDIMTTKAEGRSPSKEIMEKRKEMSNNAFLVKEKPLRERIPPAPATAPAPAPYPATATAPVPAATVAVTLPPQEKVTNEKDSNEKVKEMEFMWANKYRPKVLDDFICNQDKAIELRALVKCHLPLIILFIVLNY
jgi:hypothetical protein